MKRLDAIGLSLAIGFGASACTQTEHHQAKRVNGGIEITAEQDGIDLLANPNALEEQVGSIKAGQKVVEVCYDESATLAIDSVGVSVGLPVDQNIEYAFVGHSNAEGDIAPNFDQAPKELADQLRDC